MKKCSHCGQTVPDESRFCLHCGKEIKDNCCPHCGFEDLPEEAFFCPNCGKVIKIYDFCPCCGAPVIQPEEQSDVKINSIKNDVAAQPTTPKVNYPLTIQQLVNNMVCVEGGTFSMGNSKGNENYSDEKPAHQVSLSSFYIGKYPVTQVEWKTIMGRNPSNFQNPNRPVEYVSWNDCQMFIRKLNELTQMQFRLPTEAEWEYAARGGNYHRGYVYAGSDLVEDVAWYNRNSNGVTHEVGQKRPNELGLYDFSGNTWEWCQDWYGRYSISPLNNPVNDKSWGSFRVARGGCFKGNNSFCRITCRNYFSPNTCGEHLGLRLAADNVLK
ncbi:MAG: SUMF1/EgtB/PvdO family nonheme iron enzyme [Prevotella sp.]|nr:SUMF1/EgtB/PvdO family nonheme iron enzyme [Prevotella sp.]